MVSFSLNKSVFIFFLTCIFFLHLLSYFLGIYLINLLGVCLWFYIVLFFKRIHCEEKMNSPQRERKKVFNPTCYWYFKTPGCCLPSCNICLAIVLQLKNCSIHYFERAIWCCFIYDVVEEVHHLYYYISALPSFGFRVEGYFEKTIDRPLSTWIACGKRDSSLRGFYGDNNMSGDFYSQFKYPFIDLDKFWHYGYSKVLL